MYADHVSRQAIVQRRSRRDNCLEREDIQMEALEEERLKYSNEIRLDDDLTLIEIRIRQF